MQDTSLIILAAGKGTRMGGTIPKPLVTLGGKPLIDPIIKNGLSLGFKKLIVVISDYTQEIATLYQNLDVEFVHVEPLGTGYCVLQALSNVETPQVVIAQADDSYFYTPSTLQALVEQHRTTQCKFTVGICHISYPAKYASLDYNKKSLDIYKILKSSNDINLPSPKEVVAGLYTANTKWLKETLAMVPFNSKGEQSLPPVIDLGLANCDVIKAFSIPESEWVGINTPQELVAAQARLPN